MKIKDLPPNESLSGVHFHSIQHGVKGYWFSQWGYEDGKAGIWYKRDMKSSSVFPLFLDNLKEALEFEVIDDAKEKTAKPRKRRSDQEGLPLPGIG
jgi:hypothetical protein